MLIKGLNSLNLSLLGRSAQPNDLPGLSAWYKAESLAPAAVDPGSISGVVARYRADQFTTGTDPSLISGLVAHYRSDQGITKEIGISHLPWSIDNTDTFTGGQSDPDGGTGASLFKESSATSQHTFYSYPTTRDVVGGTGVFTASFKYSGVQWVEVVPTYMNGGKIWIDMQNGVLGTITQGINGTFSASLTSQGNGWYLLTINSTITTPITWTSAYTRIFLTTGNGVDAPSFAGDGTSGVLMYNPIFNYTIGQPVKQWTDQSGNNNHAIQNNIGSQPSYHPITSNYNSQASLHSAGAGYMAINFSTPVPRPITIIAIGDTNNSLVFSNNSGTLEAWIDTSAGWRVGSGVSSITIAGSTTTNPSFVAGVYNGASSSNYGNANVGVTGTTDNNTLNVLGVLGSNNGSGLGTATITELCIFNRVLTDAEIKSVAYYAANRYGLSIKVGSFKDSSGVNDATHDLSQAAYANMPTLTVSDANYSNQPSVAFVSASTQRLSSAAWTTPVNVARTVMVIANDDGTAAVQVFIDNQSGAATENIIYNNGGFYSLGGAASTNPVSNTPRSFVGVFNATSSVLYANSNASYAQSNAENSLTGVTLGASVSGTAPLNGKIVEVAYFNRILTQAEINGLQIYAANRYGLSLRIGSWLDQSGTADANKNQLQATYSKQPTINLADTTYNNQPTLSFTSANANYLKSGTWAQSITALATVFVVGNFDGSAVANEYFVDGATSNVGYLSNHIGTKQIEMYAGSAINFGTASAARQVICARFNLDGGTNISSLYVNAKTAVATGSSLGSVTYAGMTIGADGGVVGTTYLNGKMCEVIVYNRALTQAEISTVFEYLSAKYSISISQ